ncbi:MAG TPA: membrane protein insertion efficiency factor YidD [bacterium]|nr:membrane protein insertion efficiency factor YidD [bacterium]
MLKKILLRVIKIYQHTLSFDHGWMRYFKPLGLCRFRPTCSEYAYQAVKKYGVVKGMYLGFKRILRCNPFNQGGFDPLL